MKKFLLTCFVETKQKFLLTCFVETKQLFKFRLQNQPCPINQKQELDPVIWIVGSKPFKAQHWPCSCADLARLPQFAVA